MHCRIAASLVAACTLAACAEHAGILGAPGMSWESTPASGSHGEAKLAYGVPDTDAVELMLTCRRESNAVTVTTFASSASGQAVLTVGSGSVTSRLTAVVEENEAAEGVIISGTASVGDPTLLAFAKTGRLAISAHGRRTALPAVEPSVAQAFLASCSR